MSLKTSMTAREFARTGPETDGCELVQGELVSMLPPGKNHGIVCLNVAFLLKTYLQAFGKGRVLSNDSGLVTRRDPDTVRGVDVMVYLDPQWEGKETEGDYLVDPPDLAVEVRSPDQNWKGLLEKATEYLTMGVRLVWILDPLSRRVHVFRPDHEPMVFAPENDLDGGEVLPGFRCRVDAFFE